MSSEDLRGSLAVMAMVGKATRALGRGDPSYLTPASLDHKGYAALQRLKRKLASGGRYKPNGKRR